MTAELLSLDQMNRVLVTIRDNNPGMAEPVARRIVGEALKFVSTAAQFREIPIAPSRTVDEGWHTLILHTALYADLCDRLGGMVHHYPESPDPSRHNDGILRRTTGLIEEAGHTVDAELWTAPAKTLVPVAADCSHTPCRAVAGRSAPTLAPAAHSLCPESSGEADIHGTR